MIEIEELTSLVPHKGKMLLLSRVNRYDLEERSVEAEYHVTEDCLFYDSAAGGVPAWVGLELIAQAISALAGLRGRQRGEKPKIGFILSFTSVRIEIPFFMTGTTVEIRAKEQSCMDMVYSFEGSVFLEGGKVLEGNVTVMDVDEKQAEIFEKGE